MHFNKLIWKMGTAALLTTLRLHSAEATNPLENSVNNSQNSNSNEETQKKKIAMITKINPGQGMFSVFFTVIGYLDRYDKGELAGVHLNFGNQGLYYEPKYGLNWWEYYAEPISIGAKLGPIEFSSDQTAHHIAYQTELTLPKERIAELVKKYIIFKPSIQNEIDAFMQDKFQDKWALGIHYRGTDKGNEAPKIPYENASAILKKTIESNKKEHFVIFVATDEEPFLKFMEKEFPGKVVAQNCYRSTNGKPIHFENDSPYKQGKESVIDCILLSKCHTLLRTSSNLSLWSTYFNPDLPVIILSERHH